jgi:glutathione S-transferase
MGQRSKAGNRNLGPALRSALKGELDRGYGVWRLTGDTVTIADIAVAAPMHPHKWQRLPLDDHANLKRWMADVERLPCWQKTQGTVEQALQLK